MSKIVGLKPVAAGAGIQGISLIPLFFQGKQTIGYWIELLNWIYVSYDVLMKKCEPISHVR